MTLIHRSTPPARPSLPPHFPARLSARAAPCLAEYEYGTVATTSTHDMPPLRAWWRIANTRTNPVCAQTPPVVAAPLWAAFWRTHLCRSRVTPFFVSHAGLGATGRRQYRCLPGGVAQAGFLLVQPRVPRQPGRLVRLFFQLVPFQFPRGRFGARPCAAIACTTRGRVGYRLAFLGSRAASLAVLAKCCLILHSGSAN